MFVGQAAADTPFDRLNAQGISNARILLEHRVPLAFGSGTPMFAPSKSVNDEIDALSQIHLTPAQLINAMTADAARALGKETELGRIAPGMRADLVIADIHQTDDAGSFMTVIVVIKDGQIVVDRRD